MRRTATALVLGLIAALLSAVGTIAIATPAHAIVDRDCSDFSTQRQAQLFFLNAGGPGSDPHRLDADHDGVVCETLPCPCYYGKQKPGSKPKPSTPDKPKKKRLIQHARVIKVIDGDTVRVRLPSGKRPVVRMLGIDAPALRGRASCWGPEASASLKKRLPKGTRVRLVADLTQRLTDGNGRLLRYVIKKKGSTDMSRVQLARGNAKVHLYAGKKFERIGKYKRMQRQAKLWDRGMWGGC